MIEKIVNKIQIIIPLICFLIFVGLNMMFCLLYCGEVSDTSIVFSIFWALLFCGILELLPTVAKRIGMVLLITVSGLTCILHAVMYHLFGNFFAFSDLAYTGDGMAFFSFEYLNVRKLLILTVVGCIGLSVVLAVILKKKKYTWKNAVVGLVLMVISIVGISLQHRQIIGKIDTTMGWDTSVEESAADLYQNMSNKNYVMSMTGVYQYMYRSFMVSSGLENKLNNGEMYTYLDSYFDSVSNEIHEENEMTGIFEGKNVMFIMLESIDTWMLTEEYMPNLYKVQKESIDFTNHYSPLYISAGTFNTEFIANTSIIPPTAGVDTKVYRDNAFPYSIANCFSELGYEVNSFHSSNPHIYNRGAIHENLGYAKYHNWEDMNMENYMLDSQMMNGYDSMVSTNPFFSFIITYSGHGPYSEEMSDISSCHIDEARTLVNANPIDASKEDLKEYTYAIAHAMETDAFVGGLVQRLDEDELLEDTVLVFFTDHYGKYMTNHQLLKEIKNVDNSDFLCETPFFIYHKGTEALEVETISSTTDILPTIANMFDLQTDYRYYAGVDIFSDAEHYVVFQGNHWYDGEVYYTAEYDGTLTEEIKQRNQEISECMKRSEYILKSDYFSYLEE